MTIRYTMSRSDTNNFNLCKSQNGGGKGQLNGNCLANY